jgi:predicted nucleotide-binding protein
MMNEKNHNEFRSRPSLIIPRMRAEALLREHIKKARELREQDFGYEKDFDDARKVCGRWLGFNDELLIRLFDSNVKAEEFNRLLGRKVLAFLDQRDPTSFCNWMDEAIAWLESIVDRLELIPEAVAETENVTQKNFGGDIFVVHGRDEAAKESVARFVEKIGLKAIILHEQPNAGRTIIEKFEDYSDVGFAIVLLTPDDIGAPRDKKGQTQPRARQNVILELGYFMGKLGRGRVCALYKEGIEIPSDYQGVLYIPMDSAGAWRMALAKEIKNAGIDVDLNKL